MTSPRLTLTRSVIALAILWQALWPSIAQANAGLDAAGYMCSPASQVPAAATEQLKDVLRLAGKNPEESQEHCESCYINPVGIEPCEVFREGITRAFALKLVYFGTALRLHYSAQGPPLGGRAPPRTV